MYIGQTHRDVLLERLLPALLYIKAIAILDCGSIRMAIASFRRTENSCDWLTLERDISGLRCKTLQSPG
jgi:hypothetical protein